MPVVRNRTMNARKKSTAPTLRAMTTNVQNVTRAPPTLSESHPPIGRDTDPTTVLRAANQAVAYSGNWVDMRTGKLAE